MTIRSIQEFYVEKEQSIFVQATELPDFFHNNLLDPSRVVKIFLNDPQANLRVFYFQYLKLCFELEGPKYESYILKIEQIINNPTFKMIFYEDEDPEIYNDIQFKTLIMNFFEVLGNQQCPVYQVLQHFPIMDTVFIYFFRALLILTGKTQSIDSYIHRDELFGFLCEYFSVEIAIHNQCLKFEETDVFVYEENPAQVYMAYMDHSGVSQDNIASHYQSLQKPQMHSQEVISPPPPPQVIVETSKTAIYQPVINTNQLQVHNRKNDIVNQSYIASEFMDYTDAVNDPKKQLSSLGTDLKKSGSLGNAPTNQYFGQIIQTPTSKDVYPPVKNDISKPLEPILPQPSYGNQVEYSYNQIKYGSSGLDKINYGNTSEKPVIVLNSDKLKTNLSIDTPSSNKIGSDYLISVSNSKDNWQPTKDPGFTNSSAKNQYQSPQIDNIKPVSEVSSKYNDYKIDNSRPYTYNSPKVDPTYNQYKPASQAPSYSNKRSPFGLNVSEQFTNSMTRKAMAEPSKTNVLNIKSRARAFRSSLVSYIK